MECDKENGKETARYTFYSLRHVAASMFIEQEWTAKRVQKAMGHASVQVTFDIYGRLSDAGNDREAMAQMRLGFRAKLGRSATYLTQFIDSVGYFSDKMTAFFQEGLWKS